MALKVFYFGEVAVAVPDAWDAVTVHGAVYRRRRDEQGRHAYWVRGDGQIFGGRGMAQAFVPR